MKPAAFWSRLIKRIPSSLQHAMLLGSTGRGHLGMTGSLMFQEAVKGGAEAELLLTTARQMLAASRQCDVLHGPAAAAEVQAHTGVDMPALLKDSAKYTASHWQAPQTFDDVVKLVEVKDYEGLEKLFRRRCAEEPENLFWRGRFLSHAGFMGDGKLVEEAATMPWPAELAFVPASLRADAAFAAGDFEGAENLYAEAASLSGMVLFALRKAEAGLKLGRRGQAKALWLELLQKEPWRVSTLLKLYDLEKGLDEACEPPGGALAVMIYSYNKAEPLAETIDALMASRLHGARVIVLDNGSSDGTADMLAAKVDRHGAENLQLVTLPVNIGAPAARNWLMALPEVKQSDYCAYLDDDAVVPADWLERLGTALAAYPEAGVWGCKVVEADRPHIMQHCDLHILPPGQGEHHFGLSKLHLETPDFGDFDYIRPCSSVTGCCHLFKTERLLASGPFGIQFSPSQFDDLEHDMRIVLDGREVVYQGHLRVKHMKAVGRSTNPAAKVNAEANRAKLCVAHPEEDIAKLTAADYSSLSADFLTKCEALEHLFK
jgi:hypothetical protein